MFLNGEVPRRIIILTTKVLENLVDTVPVGVRQKITGGFGLATSCIAVAVPFLYAATNRNSNFLSRG